MVRGLALREQGDLSVSEISFLSVASSHLHIKNTHRCEVWKLTPQPGSVEGFLRGFLFILHILIFNLYNNNVLSSTLNRIMLGFFSSKSGLTRWNWTGSEDEREVFSDMRENLTGFNLVFLYTHGSVSKLCWEISVPLSAGVCCPCWSWSWTCVCVCEDLLCFASTCETQCHYGCCVFVVKHMFKSHSVFQMKVETHRRLACILPFGNFPVQLLLRSRDRLSRK